jgi:Sulfotransferase domain
VRYFENRPGKLLVIDICNGDGYEKLCPFLGLPTINEAFPKENHTGSGSAHGG